MKKIKYIAAIVISSIALQSNGGLLFNYSQLALKDLDQMNSMVMSKIKESRKSDSGKNVPLKEALQAIYTRPNTDGMIEKIVGPLRTELDEMNAWEQTLNDLTVEALDALKNTRAFRPIVQVSYQIFLENLLIDMKPFARKAGFEKGLTEKIRDAKVGQSKESSSERRLRMMKSTISPSDLAKQILEEARKKEAIEKKSAESETETKSVPVVDDSIEGK